MGDDIKQNLETSSSSQISSDERKPALILSSSSVTAEEIFKKAQSCFYVFYLLDEYISQREKGVRLTKEEAECFEILGKESSKFAEWISQYGPEHIQSIVDASPLKTKINELCGQIGMIAALSQKRMLKCYQKMQKEKGA